MFKLFVILVGLCGPFLVWIAIILAERWGAHNLHSMLRGVKVWRRITWAIGVMLCLCHFTPLHLGWGYAWAAVMFSLGLSFAEFWLKSRLMPGAPS